MSKYRTFEVNDEKMNLLGIIDFKSDEEEKTIFPKLKRIGLALTKRKHKLVWWDEDYIEIINKKTDLTIGMMEVIYR